MHDSTDAPVGGISLTERHDSTVVHLWGEIDDALRHQAGTALAEALDRDRPVVLDAGRVTFIDSTGIAFLIQFCTIGREEGLAVTLREPPPIVTDVLEMLGLAGMFAEPTSVSSDGVRVDAGIDPPGTAS
ncbi:STAS domain-containing protein [Actinotalea sp. K2]|uniref:STAS domain-containing protein n=1 Tax=Actinotalea sp. K2 TaxID=2939438 RepID=UPI002016B6EF|nr:STAS domain-containing protein [Actinotalea sp. K2]MCL3860689.1 STAS domain-containing protein [Actinotalea sp. K2]